MIGEAISSGDMWLLSLFAAVGVIIIISFIGMLMYEYGFFWILGWVIGIAALACGSTFIAHWVLTRWA